MIAFHLSTMKLLPSVCFAKVSEAQQLGGGPGVPHEPGAFVALLERSGQDAIAEWRAHRRWVPGSAVMRTP